jgi:hypothetical protein
MLHASRKLEEGGPMTDNNTGNGAGGAGEIRAKRLVIVDDEGRERIVLEGGDVVIRDERGAVRVIAGVDETISYVQLFDGEEAARVVATVEADGRASFVEIDGTDNDFVQLGVSLGREPGDRAQVVVGNGEVDAAGIVQPSVQGLPFDLEIEEEE